LFNAFADMCMTGVPRLAIDSIKINLNLSCTNDYIWADILASIPLTSTHEALATLRFPDECDCTSQACPKCSIPMTLAVQHPNDDGKENMHAVFASHVQIPVASQHLVKIDPAAASQILAFLTPDQRIDIQGFIHKSQFDEQEQAAFYPCTNRPSIRGRAKITVNQALKRQLTPDQLQALAKHCPAKVFNQVLDIEDDQKCIQCHLCEQVAAEQFRVPKLIQIEDGPPYDLYIETKMHNPLEHVRIALDSLKSVLISIRRAALSAGQPSSS